MGLNWSLSIPSVDIHTGWGVPRYDSSLETETYTLSGGFRFTLPTLRLLVWQPGLSLYLLNGLNWPGLTVRWQLRGKINYGWLVLRKMLSDIVSFMLCCRLMQIISR